MLVKKKLKKFCGYFSTLGHLKYINQLYTQIFGLKVISFQQIKITKKKERKKGSKELFK